MTEMKGRDRMETETTEGKDMRREGGKETESKYEGEATKEKTQKGKDRQHFFQISLRHLFCTFFACLLYFLPISTRLGVFSNSIRHEVKKVKPKS
jgi:hypothetical protein